MSTIMRCKRLFKNDRICDLCKLANIIYYNECKIEYREDTNKFNKFLPISLTCPDKYQEWDEYTPYNMCKILKDSCSAYTCHRLKENK